MVCEAVGNRKKGMPWNDPAASYFHVNSPTMEQELPNKGHWDSWRATRKKVAWLHTHSRHQRTLHVNGAQDHLEPIWHILGVAA